MPGTGRNWYGFCLCIDLSRYYLYTWFLHMVFEATEGNRISQPTARSGPLCPQVPSSYPALVLHHWEPSCGRSISRDQTNGRQGTRADGGQPGGEGGNCVFLSLPSGQYLYLFLYSATCFSCLDSQDELPLVNTD